LGGTGFFSGGEAKTRSDRVGLEGGGYDAKGKLFDLRRFKRPCKPSIRRKKQKNLKHRPMHL